MEGSIAAVLTMGLGSWGSNGLILTLGYGSAVPPVGRATFIRSTVYVATAIQESVSVAHTIEDPVYVVHTIKRPVIA